MFIGRTSEIRALESMHTEKRFQFAVVYGRRRVGKTYLLTHFIQSKPNLYFAAEEYNHKILLEKFSDAILKKFPSEYLNSFDSFEQAVLYLGIQAKHERLVLVIDEFQYWVMQNKGILSALQNIIDHQLIHTHLFLILCGSYISFMEDEVLGYKSPLFGRRTGQFKVEPFDFFDAQYFYPAYSLQDRLLAYAVVGGVPQYLSFFSDAKSIRNNILDNILRKNAYLHEEPYFVLKQELKEPAVYFSVLEAISKGATKYNEISTKIGRDCGFYLNTLIHLQIVGRELPTGVKSTSRRAAYSIQDNLFHFWFRFISDIKPLIEQELYEVAYDQSIGPYLSLHAAGVFERVCIQFLKRINGTDRLPFVFHHIGRWWGTDKVRRQETEVDILAIDKEDNVLIGECKWRNEKVDIGVVKALIEKGALLPYQNKHYILFSKSGYTSAAYDFARTNPAVLCFDLMDMNISS